MKTARCHTERYGAQSIQWTANGGNDAFASSCRRESTGAARLCGGVPPSIPKYMVVLEQPARQFLTRQVICCLLLFIVGVQADAHVL